MGNQQTRRRFLLTAGMVGLAGCGSASEPTIDTETTGRSPTDTATDTPTDRPGTGTETDSPTEGSLREYESIWSYSNGWSSSGYAPSRPIVHHDGAVYVQGSELIALAVDDGEERWSVDAGALFGVSTAGVVTGNTLRRRSDGSVRESVSESLSGTPQIVEGTDLYTQITDGPHILNYDLTTGTEQWRQRTPDIWGSAYGLDREYFWSEEGIVYLRSSEGSGFEVVTLSSDTGETRSVTPVSGSELTLIGAAGSTAVLLGGSTEQFRVLGIDVGAARQQWEQTMEVSRVWIGQTELGRMHRFAPESIVFPTTEEASSDDADREYAFFVQSLDLADGTPRWKTEVPPVEYGRSEFRLNTAVGPETVYFSEYSTNGEKTVGFNRGGGSIVMDESVHTMAASDRGVFGLDNTDEGIQLELLRYRS
jgi:outer membrane protein assembly factor BamB